MLYGISGLQGVEWKECVAVDGVSGLSLRCTEQMTGPLKEELRTNARVLPTNNEQRPTPQRLPAKSGLFRRLQISLTIGARPPGRVGCAGAGAAMVQVLVVKHNQPTVLDVWEVQFRKSHTRYFHPVRVFQDWYMHATPLNHLKSLSILRIAHVPPSPSTGPSHAHLECRTLLARECRNSRYSDADGHTITRSDSQGFVARPSVMQNRCLSSAGPSRPSTVASPVRSLFRTSPPLCPSSLAGTFLLLYHIDPTCDSTAHAFDSLGLKAVQPVGPLLLWKFLPAVCETSTALINDELPQSTEDRNTLTNLTPDR
ncbi:hypothetical protein EJ06DRAFT_415308 [Trichodelitschia bisporula]|uniref:Uncharacterized protein n=1 Tax=Trichodelitschia bisporula TaxID=703511 RepID=A0A6G1HYS8_9PEZI|nr:hypothetical protein EJ06DRAFT_415308 [Trichodelitschia bisporula]